jgi:hypothetical protein
LAKEQARQLEALKAELPTQQITKGKLRVVDTSSPTDEKQIRALALEQIERRRRFQMRAVSYAAASIVLIWAITEYHNAGGWPSDGFSRSSSIPHVWNIWIIYPVLGLGLLLALDAWNIFVRKPISESEILREIERLVG